MDTIPTGPPAVGGCALHAAGVDWDAVRVPRVLGLTALDITGPRSGAAIDDGHGPYWFLPSGAGHDWDGQSTRLLARGSSLTVPPARRTQGPGPTGGSARVTRTGTPSLRLCAALEDALDTGTRARSAKQEAS
ncbi:hypothetical protein ACFXPM_29805 [Streptomyces sp. NPDC059095]|uniref:hypothetical protein n=1 Tax=Streptomyces sp. NPDC059095 TaxID=3346726 RepID=UPI0036CF1606